MNYFIYVRQLEVPYRHDEKAVKETVFRERKEEGYTSKSTKIVGIEVKCFAK